MNLRTVVFVTPHFPPHVGGVEQYVSHLAAELLRSGRVERAVVVTTARRGCAVGPGAPVHPGLVVRTLPTLATVSETPLGLGWSGRLRRIIADEDPDLINAHAPVPVLADLAAQAAGKRPFVLTYHTGPMRKGRLAVDLGLRAYESMVLRRTAARASRVICSSGYVRDSLGRLLPERTVVVSAGADLDVFTVQLRPAAGRRILFVGSLYRATRYKGLDTLLDATALMHDAGTDVTLEVVGGGDALPDYRSQSERLGLAAHVTFSGVLTGSALVEAYQRATVVAVPSRFDSLPSVIVEAMACGVPVVVSRVGGIPEVVEHERQGLLVEPGDPRALAAALTRVVQDPGFALAAGRAARQLVESTLSWRIQAGRTADVFEQAVLESRADVPAGDGSERLPPTVGTPGPSLP